MPRKKLVLTETECECPDCSIVQECDLKTAALAVAQEAENTKHCLPAWTETQLSVLDDWAARLREAAKETP